VAYSPSRSRSSAIFSRRRVIALTAAHPVEQALDHRGELEGLKGFVM
jgi:hypothetical protein